MEFVEAGDGVSKRMKRTRRKRRTKMIRSGLYPSPGRSLTRLCHSSGSREAVYVFLKIASPVLRNPHTKDQGSRINPKRRRDASVSWSLLLPFQAERRWIILILRSNCQVEPFAYINHSTSFRYLPYSFRRNFPIQSKASRHVSSPDEHRLSRGRAVPHHHEQGAREAIRLDLG